MGRARRLTLALRCLPIAGHRSAAFLGFACAKLPREHSTEQANLIGLFPILVRRLRSRKVACQAMTETESEGDGDKEVHSAMYGILKCQVSHFPATKLFAMVEAH